MKILNIAGLSLVIKGSHAEEFVDEVEGMSVFVGEAHENYEQAVIEFDHDLTVKCDYEVVHEFLIAEDNAECRLGRREKGYVVEMVPSDKSLPVFRMEYEGGDVFRATAVENATIFRFALWMAYCLKGGLCHRALIHASTIVYGGKAVLFLGESGTLARTRFAQK